VIRTNKRSLLYVLIALLLIGCASSQQPARIAQSLPGGIGGTGIVSEEDTVNREGIGGTGKTIDEGIGGTGKMAYSRSDEGEGGIGGTGIVGTITAFGSIWVDQAHVHFDNSVPITINQQAATAGELQLGQVVAVISQELDSQAEQPEFQAQSIDIIHEVVGPVSKISASDRFIEVMQQPIQLADNAVLFDHTNGTTITLDQLTLDNNIEVSGLRQTSGHIIASRIDILPDIEQVQLIGELSQTEHGQWFISKQEVVIDELLLIDDLNQRVLISGQLEDGIMIAETIGIDSVESILDQVTEVIYEGNLFDLGDEGFHDPSDLIFNLDSSSEQFYEQGSFDSGEVYDEEEFEHEAFEDEPYEGGGWQSEDYYEYFEIEGYEAELGDELIDEDINYEELELEDYEPEEYENYEDD